MSKQQLKGIGLFLGALVALMALMQFIATWKAGNPNYYLVVMTCGMLLLIYYTFASASGRRRR